MAPKGKAKAKAKTKVAAAAQEAASLARPKVTEAEVADARKTLDDKDAKRRASSNMLYYLEQRGEKLSYENLPPRERKLFAVEWFAWSIKEGNVTKSSSRSVNHQTKHKDIGTWLSKEAMVKQYGEKKAEAKVAHLEGIPDRHRPDRDTGLDDPDNREYLLFNDEHQGNTITDLVHSLDTDKGVTSEQGKKEAEEDMEAFANAGIASGSVIVPARAPGSASSEPAGSATVKVEGAKPDENLKTFYACQSKPKIVLRSLGDVVVDLKRMFELCADPKRKRYTEALSTDIGKLLPKLKTDFGNIEKVHNRAGTDAPVPDSEILATARKLDQHYEEVGTITDWFNRMVPKQTNKKPE